MLPGPVHSPGKPSPHVVEALTALEPRPASELQGREAASDLIAVLLLRVRCREEAVWDWNQMCKATRWG